MMAADAVLQILSPVGTNFARYVDMPDAQETVKYSEVRCSGSLIIF